MELAKRNTKYGKRSGGTCSPDSSPENEAAPHPFVTLAMGDPDCCAGSSIWIRLCKPDGDR